MKKYAIEEPSPAQFVFALRPNAGYKRYLDHTQRRTTVGRTPLGEWSARRRDLTWLHSTFTRERDIHAPGGMRTHNLSRRAAADLRLRRRGHWERLSFTVSL